MPELLLKLKRERLYDEIWEILVSGVAKKYEVPYAALLKLCKETDIPIPPSGYWTKLSFGKPVIKVSLPESPITEVTLPTNAVLKPTTKRVTISLDENRTNVQQRENLHSSGEKVVEINTSEKQQADEVQDISQGLQLSYRTADGKHNTYNRQILYEEV